MSWVDMTPEEARRKMIAAMRFDADEGSDDESETERPQEAKGGHGNTRLPYGLCKRFGIDLPDDATPREAWNALEEGTGYSHDEVMEMVKKAGSAKDVQTKKGGESVSEATSREGGAARLKGAGLKDPKSMRGMGVKEHKHFETMDEAQSYLKNELGIPVNYTKARGMTPERANKFNDAILTVADELGIKPRYVSTRHEKNNAVMGVEFYNWNIAGLQTLNICNLDGIDDEYNCSYDPEKWKSMTEKNVKGLQSYIDSLEETNKWGWNDAEIKKEKKVLNKRIKDAKYRCYHVCGKGAEVEYSAFHEMGHSLAFKVEGGMHMRHPSIESAWARARKVKNGQKDMYDISEYADTNEDEFFAECFAGYMFGADLPDYCNEMVESVIADLGKLREGGFDDDKGVWNDAE